MIKVFNIKVKIVWGGAHPTLYPEEAMEYADTICRGEGEKWMSSFLGVEYKADRHSFQGYNCNIYDFKHMAFRRLTDIDYSIWAGILYRTLWTVGCPYSCSYCANSALIKLDPEYRKLRYPDVKWIIQEVLEAKAQYPFITTVAFDDDNFISLPLETIVKFCYEWQTMVRLPFVIYGMHPNTVNRRKVELLAQAGMNRVRMGIQSFSPATLEFYNRPTKIEKIRESANILIDVSRKYHMVPPAFDIITDNPLDNSGDVNLTLYELYELHRPYTLTIFSLRSFKGTELYKTLPNLPDTPYTETRATINNVILYLLACWKIPKWLYNYLMRLYLADNHKLWPYVHKLCKTIYSVKRGLDHIRHGDLSRLGGKWGYWIWRITKW